MSTHAVPAAFAPPNCAGSDDDGDGPDGRGGFAGAGDDEDGSAGVGDEGSGGAFGPPPTGGGGGAGPGGLGTCPFGGGGRRRPGLRLVGLGVCRPASASSGDELHMLPISTVASLNANSKACFGLGRKME